MNLEFELLRFKMWLVYATNRLYKNISWTYQYKSIYDLVKKDSEGLVNEVRSKFTWTALPILLFVFLILDLLQTAVVGFVVGVGWVAINYWCHGDFGIESTTEVAITFWYAWLIMGTVFSIVILFWQFVFNIIIEIGRFIKFAYLKIKR